MPGIFIETFIGVRVPKCHAFTKEFFLIWTLPQESPYSDINI